MLVPRCSARSGLAGAGSPDPVSTQIHASLASRYSLTPGVGVGPLRFGDHVTDHPQLTISDPEPEHADADYAEYAIAGVDQTLIIYVDADGRIDSASFYEFCVVDERDLIGMGVGELLVVLGSPDAIEAEAIGNEVELLYAYDELGLTIWTIDGEVCVVQARAVADEEDEEAEEEDDE